MELTVVTGGKGSRTPLADIDKAVIDAVEEGYVFGQESGDRLSTPAFTDDKGEPDQEAAEDFLKEMRDYAYQREAGRLVVTGNTTKKGHARFRVTEYVAPEKDDEDATA